MRNGPNETPSRNLNPVMDSIINKGVLDSADAQELLKRYEANKSGLVIYSQKNLELFRRMLKIETNDRHFGTQEIMLLRMVVKSQTEGILDGTDPATKSEPQKQGDGEVVVAGKKLKPTTRLPNGVTEDQSQTLTLRGKGEWGRLKFSPLDLKNLARMVKAEAGGESDEGKKAVATVICNRILDGRFGSGLNGVIFNREFSPYTDGRFNKTQCDKETLTLVTDLLLSGKNPLDNALFFQASYITDNGIKRRKGGKMVVEDSWMKKANDWIARIGGHDFFGPKGGLQASRKPQKDDTIQS